jgi:radical SAM protein with 4Fe4S-binding SPASM domain
MCYTINHKEKKFMLGVADIDRVLEECKAHNLPAMVVGLGSEVLLYKQIQDVLSRIRSAGVMDVFLGTNGVLLNDEICDFVVDNKIARVEISIDATTRETYQKIRGKDEFERVTSNVRRLIEAKRRKNSDLPIIRLCFCVQELNIDEADEFVETWRDLVDYVDLQEMIDFSYVDELRATGTIKEIENIRNEDIDETYCAYPFNSLHVWANGDITPCCTFFGKSLVVGNIKDTTLTDVWNGDGMQQIRQEILSGNLNPTCKVCLAQRDRERFAAAQKKVSD